MNVAIIPARGGSKRIPKKNIISFAGKEMISYSIIAAKESRLFENIIVSTDDDEIKKIAEKYGAVVLQRSSKNSDDYSTATDVILESLDILKTKYGKVYENTCCIYGCAPFTTANDLKSAYKKLINEKASSVISIVKYSHPIERSFVKTNDNIKYLYPEYYKTRTQDLEAKYHDAGQFYWYNTKDFCKNKNYVMDNTIGYEISESKIHDIDTKEDLIIAEQKYKNLINYKPKYTSLADYNDLEKGNTIYIIGNGTYLAELTDKQISKINTKTSIGVNSSFVCIESDYYIAGHLQQTFLQGHFGKKGSYKIFHGELQNWPFPPEWNVLSIANINIVGDVGYLPKPVSEKGPLVGAQNVGYSATHLAYILGASKIVYIGFDFKSNLHFYNIHEKYNQKLHEHWEFTKEEYKDNTFAINDINDFGKSLYKKEILENTPFGGRSYSYQDALDNFTGYFNVMKQNGVEIISAQDNNILTYAGAKYIPLDDILKEK
jgi:pseudaminic acid cytidylyltransferase